MPFADIVFATLVPALTAGFVLLAGTRASTSARRPRPVLGAIALGLGYLVAHVAILSWPPIPFGEQELAARDWTFWLVIAAIVLAPARLLRLWRRFATPIYVALLSASIFHFTLSQVLKNDARGIAIRLGLSLMLYIVWTATDRLAHRRAGPALPASLFVTGVGVALVAICAHMYSVAAQAGAVSAGLVAAALVFVLDRRARFPTGGVAIVLVVLSGALVNAAIYDAPSWSWLLLACSPLWPWIGEARRFERLSTGKKCMLDMLLTSIPTVIAVLLAWRASVPPEST